MQSESTVLYSFFYWEGDDGRRSISLDQLEGMDSRGEETRCESREQCKSLHSEHIENYVKR